MDLELSHCSWLFATGCAAATLGICVVGTALGTFAITSSFVGVFPFGTPLWLGALFLTLGCFMFVAYQPTKFQLPASSKNRVWFTLVLSVFGVLESILAICLFLWYRAIVQPTLHQCSPDLTSLSHPPPSSSSSSSSDSAPHQLVTCECIRGFVDPPTLRTTVHRFAGVSDCSELGVVLGVFHWVLLGMYSAGVLLTLLVCLLSARRLHSSGVCGKSGVYAVTPQRNSPVTMQDLSGSAVNGQSQPQPQQVQQQQQQQVPVCYSSVTRSPGHSGVGVASVVGSASICHSVTNFPSFAINQRLNASSQGTVNSLYTHSPPTMRAHPSPSHPSSSSSHPSPSHHSPSRRRHYSSQSTPSHTAV